MRRSEFNGFDLLISRVATDSEVIVALSAALRLTHEEIAVIDKFPLEAFGAAVKVMCIKVEVEGEFRLKLSIDLFSDEIMVPREQVAREIAYRLDVSVLLDDGSPNPYRMLLVKSGEAPEIAYLHADDADEGVYRLII